MDELAIPLAGRGISGTVRLPGSKSITHRGLVLGAMAGGKTRLANSSDADDCLRTAGALGLLGAGIHRSGHTVTLHGWDHRPPAGDCRIDAGESGTTARFVLPLLALGRGRRELAGGARMARRPMAPLAEALEQLGAGIQWPRPGVSLPLVVRTAGIDGGAVELDARLSSQFASGLLLAAPGFPRGLELSLSGGTMASRPYLEMTIALMARFGVQVEQLGEGLYRLPAGSRYRAADLEVEGDASSASYFCAAAALCGGRVRCEPLDTAGSLQGDAGFARLLERMGCSLEHGPGWVAVSSDGRPLRPLVASMNGMPDLVPTLAVAALFARGRSVISGVPHLRVKESDRLGDLSRELRRLGGTVRETEDGLEIEGDGGDGLRGARLATYNDHRLAMALALAGLRLSGTTIETPGCVGKSHPGFFGQLFSLASGSG